MPPFSLVWVVASTDFDVSFRHVKPEKYRAFYPVDKLKLLRISSYHHHDHLQTGSNSTGGPNQNVAPEYVEQMEDSDNKRNTTSYRYYQ